MNWVQVGAWDLSLALRRFDQDGVLVVILLVAQVSGALSAAAIVRQQGVEFSRHPDTSQETEGILWHSRAFACCLLCPGNLGNFVFHQDVALLARFKENAEILANRR